MKHLRLFEGYKITPEFKKGDIVICIDTIGGILKYNQLYKITNVHIHKEHQSSYYSVNNLNAIWSEKRFIKATDEEIDQLKYNL